MNANVPFLRYTQVLTLFIIAQIEDKASIIPLVAGMRKEVQALISEGIQLVWESYKLDPYVQKFSDTIVSFQERVEELVLVGEQLEVDIRSLETCPYSANTFADILAKIQHAVDDLSLKQYSNLHIWVSRLDDEVGLQHSKKMYILLDLRYINCVGGEKSCQSPRSRCESLDRLLERYQKRS